MTFLLPNVIIWEHGELSERFKELVLKTSDPERDLGFESLTLRQNRQTLIGFADFLFYLFTIAFHIYVISHMM